MGSSVKKSHLSEIRSLVKSLSDRDIKIKRDIRLFEEFFANFPIPVSIWSVTKEGTVVSQRGNGLICHDAKCINTLFSEFNDNAYSKLHKNIIIKKEDKEEVFLEINLNKVQRTNQKIEINIPDSYEKI